MRHAFTASMILESGQLVEKIFQWFVPVSCNWKVTTDSAKSLLFPGDDSERTRLHFLPMGRAPRDVLTTRALPWSSHKHAHEYSYSEFMHCVQ